MITIFVAIVKKGIIDLITESMGKSESADSSLLNKCRETVGYGRNIELAQLKRSNLSELKIKVEDYELTEGMNDADAVNELKHFFQICEQKITQLRRQTMMSQGQTDLDLKKLPEFTEQLFELFDRAQLLNVQYDKKPFHEFQYYVGLYFSFKVQEQQSISTLKEVLEHPQITNYRTCASQRENLIIDALTSTLVTLRLAELNPNESDTALCRNLVLIHVQLLQANNICQSNQYRTKLNTLTQLLNSFDLKKEDVVVLNELLSTASQSIQNFLPTNKDNWILVPSTCAELVEELSIPIESAYNTSKDPEPTHHRSLFSSSTSLETLSNVSTEHTQNTSPSKFV